MLRVFKKPVSYGPDINRVAYKILPISILIHIFISILAFTAEEIFPTRLTGAPMAQQFNNPNLMPGQQPNNVQGNNTTNNQTNNQVSNHSNN